MAAVTLGSKAVGSIVKLKVDGTLTDFIVVQQGRPNATLYDASCDGIWLLMKECYERSSWRSDRQLNDYANSTIHSYLNGDFLNKFDANIKSAIKQVKIPYRVGYGSDTTVTGGSSGLSAKIFLLSSTETAFIQSNMPTNEGVTLSYFSGCTANGADNKRIANLNGSAEQWWLRSPCCGGNATRVMLVLANGSLDDTLCSTPYGIRPALVLPSSLWVSDDGSVSMNTAPTTPASINVPSSISGGTNITVSWGISTDAEGNLAGYKVEKSVNGGSTWSQIYQGTALSTTDAVAFGTVSVMYRVKAYDTQGLESGYKTSGQVTVVNNRAPGAPASITVPVTVNGGTSLVISWGAATDSDGNLSGYELERQYNGGELGAALSRGQADLHGQHHQGLEYGGLPCPRL